MLFHAMPPAHSTLASYVPHHFLFRNRSPSSRQQTLNHHPNLACKAKASDSDSDSDTPKHNPDKKQITEEPKLDRRGFLLVGFGSSGIYNTIPNLNKLSPDFVNCVDVIKLDGKHIDCCPPKPRPLSAADITDFVFPSATTAHVRMAAHSSGGNATMQKYRKAVELMKKLPPNDPRSFANQANVHCAYCDGGYNQAGFSDLKFEIHQSWLFFPFHRWYVYFFERICAKLIDDDTFALPFWNWDSPSGMEIPAAFNAVGSPLYDRRRDQDHLPPAVADLNWGDYSTTVLSRETQTEYNLSVMYKQMVTNATTPKLFMGQPFKPGDDITDMYGAGSMEVAPHNAVHSWTGDARAPFNENMGAFYSAARDPIFFAHHANIDRLWEIWEKKLGGEVFTDPDWLETSYVFYDEESKPVRVRTKDCLDISRLGYAYQEVETPWIGAKPHPRRRRTIKLPCGNDAHGVSRVFPKTLDGVLNVSVKRPTRLRSWNEKEEEEEVLVIEGIACDNNRLVKFDVYINEDDVGSCTPKNTEFLGSFVNVPRGHDGGRQRDDLMGRGSQRFGLSSVLVELGADEDEILSVTLVPRRGRVRVGGIRIEFDASKSSP